VIEVQVLIPVADTAGVTFDPSFDVEFETFLATEFGGFSQLPGLVSGGWVSAGVFYPDHHRVYMVSLTSICDGGKVRKMADTAKATYQQLAVYIRYLGLAEII